MTATQPGPNGKEYTFYIEDSRSPSHVTIRYDHAQDRLWIRNKNPIPSTVTDQGDIYIHLEDVATLIRVSEQSYASVLVDTSSAGPLAWYISWIEVTRWATPRVKKEYMRRIRLEDSKLKSVPRLEKE